MPKNPRTKERQKNELAEQPEGSSRSQNQEKATLPDDKQGRLLSLAKKLQQLFPEQYEELAQIIERVEQENVGSRQSEQGLVKSAPISIPGKQNKAIKGHSKAASGGSQDEEEEIDPRGRAPEQKDPLIHLFVDHSNILYGLPQPKSATPYRERSNTLPSRVDSVTAPIVVATSSRPLPIPSTGPKASQDKMQSLSRSFPTTSPLTAGLGTSDQSRELEPRTSATSHELGVNDTDPKQTKKKLSRRLWYAAFVLVLERGRPVTRRVVVASRKPTETLPIEAIEQFGYEVRVLVRVPNTGDGSANKVKFREQGVDELLQLKLYQAITDPEPGNIPAGSTIILATGDGGPGQFDKQGFLGPIKTALRGGWNVELYAWEDSLSRAWEREFGEEIKSGKFRIIGMKQFARWLAHDWV